MKKTKKDVSTLLDPSGTWNPKNAETANPAISAAVGCGLYENFQKAVDAMVSVKKSYVPVAKNALRYEKFYRGVYTKLYESVRAFTKTIADINEEFGD